MKNILIPTDFSQYAMNATKLAAHFARKYNAKLYFLHSSGIEAKQYKGRESKNVETKENKELITSIQQKFDELFKQKFLQEINKESIIKHSIIYSDIIEQSKQLKIDLIIMGTHGTSGYINDLLVGSNTDKVVRSSSIPVLTLSEEVINPNFKTIVFASDFGEIVDQSFHHIIRFSKLIGAEIKFVRVITKDDFYNSGEMLDTMDNFASSHGLQDYSCHIWTAENVQNGINEFAKRFDADLIATITHGRRGLARLLNGSVTNELIKSSPLPTFTICSPYHD